MKLNKGWVLGLGAAALGLSACNGAREARGIASSSVPITLAVKFVEFKDAQGNVPLTQTQTVAVVNQINSEWRQCGMAVRMEQYEQVDPTATNLPFGINSMDQLDQVRSPFDDPKYLVVINTGAWDHNQMGPANAWTAMPGSNPLGAVLEAPVAKNGQIVAHELGHYLGLDHVSDVADMMDPVIYPSSTKITSEQCQAMQTAARSSRPEALRT